MRTGIFTSWPRKIDFLVPNPDKPGQALMFTSRRSYVWWMIRRGHVPFAFLIPKFFWWSVFRLFKLFVLPFIHQSQEPPGSPPGLDSSAKN